MILRPRLSTAVRRAAARRGDPVGEAAVVERIWSGFANLGALEAHVIDNDAQDPVETADAIERRSAAGLLRTATEATDP